MTKLAPYTKTIAGLVGAVATALLGSFGPDTAIGHTLTIVIAVATALSVYAFPNTPQVVDPLDEDLGDPNAVSG